MWFSFGGGSGRWRNRRFWGYGRSYAQALFQSVDARGKGRHLRFKRIQFLLWIGHAGYATLAVGN